MPRVIRASSLPQYTDCMRRYAARSYPELVAEQGFNLNTIAASIGAVIGTATHEALGLILTNKMAGLETESEAWQQKIFETVGVNVAEGVVWDNTTVSADAAIRQARRMVIAVQQAVLDDIDPVAVECEYEADIGDGFILRGHLDVLEKIRIRDFKTGTVQRANQAQYGGYSLLARSNGHAVDTLEEIYIKRAGAKRPQPFPEIAEYSLQESERAAFDTFKHIKSSVTAFEKSGDERIFLPNPNSMMCSPKYCPAHGTDFCKAHKGKIFGE